MKLQAFQLWQDKVSHGTLLNAERWLMTCPNCQLFGVYLDGGKVCIAPASFLDRYVDTLSRERLQALLAPSFPQPIECGGIEL